MYPFFYGANHQRKLFHISDKLIACQRNCHVVNLSTSFTFEFPRKPNQQEQVWDQSSFEGFPPLIFSISSKETVSSYTEEMARRGAAPVTVTVDILHITKGAPVWSIETVVPFGRAILFISFNSHHQ